MLRKAVIPCAGLGMRLWPLTRALPKAFLPVVDKPVLQYGIEECFNSGLKEIIIIGSPRFESLFSSYFTPQTELEKFMGTRKKKKEIKYLRRFKEFLSQIKLTLINQPQPRGLGDALLRAEKVIGQEPFAVLLPDDLIFSREPCLQQLSLIFDKFGYPVVALEKMSPEEIEKSGVVKARKIERRVFNLQDMVEKPKFCKAPSDLGIVGRYVLLPEIFRVLKKVKSGSGGEKQLTDGLKMLLAEKPIYGYLYKGKRYDVGCKPGWLMANFELSLRQKNLARLLRERLQPPTRNT
ncbi:MAG: UTP--glucose-1-phosphate uridylyltransferase [Candidatus Aminicenantales bacterium]